MLFIHWIFESIKNYLALIISVIVITSAALVQSYYEVYFGFNIVPYISTSELIMMSFMTLGHFSIFQFISNATFFYNIYNKVNYNNISSPKQAFHLEVIPIDIDFTSMLIILVPIISWITEILYQVYLYYFPKLLYNLVEDTLLAYIVIAIVLYMIWKGNKNEKKTRRVSLNSIQILLVFICINLCSILRLTMIEGITISQNQKFEGTIIKTENEIFVSDSKLTYVGQTEKYLLHYKLEEKMMIVTPMDQVIYQKIKSKNIVQQANWNLFNLNNFF